MKYSRFNNVLRAEDYLVHNTLADTVLKVKNPALKQTIDDLASGKPFTYDENDDFHKTLKDLNMLVEDSENEMNTLNSLYFEFEHRSELGVVMLVTRKCNFRCPYCYEEYIDSDMSPQVFDDTRNFILNRIKQDHFKVVYVSFFGGEPSLMSKEIIAFMEQLLKENDELPEPAKIYGVITTNGYLLTPDVIDKFVENHITRYQITVDGLEESHNSSRYLIGKQGTWKQIISNLQYFKQVDSPNLNVLIRSNITPAIYSEIDEWLAFLNDNFNQYPYRFHFETAKDFGHMNDKSFGLLTDESAVLMDIMDRAKKYKLPLEIVGFHTKPFSMVCYAARQFTYIVDYDGGVKKCTSSALDEPYNCIGKLTSEGLDIDFKKSAQWTSYDLGEPCKSCPILALCYMRKCPVGRRTYQQCNLLIDGYWKGLEYFYL